ncbi:MAG TPA: acyl-CoA dehydrogenase family protein [Steroidobacteraceae bacterium]|nr:acyl-CoA dehydrogenase family protein [Steroidobacteraceae bacterium]
MSESMTAADIKQAALALVPEIEARAAEIEALRHLPADLVSQLKRAGAFRMLMPRAWGGPEMSPREQNEVIEIYSRADPSVGWCVMIGSDSGFFVGYHTESAARELYPGLDGCVAGAASPLGRAERVPGGYRVNGRWSFGSGVNHADVIIGICPTFDAQGAIHVNGVPEVRVVAAPAAKWEILDTWHTLGLAGSGSNDYVARDLFIPEGHTIPMSLDTRPTRPEPLYGWFPLFLANMHGVALGLARRAISTLETLAQTKRAPNFTRAGESLAMKDVPRVRSTVAKAEMLLGASRAYTYETMDRLWAELQRDRAVSGETRLAVALSRQYAFRTAREITQMMVDAAGSSAIYRGQPLERLLRDAYTTCMHWSAQERTLEPLGGVILCDESAGPML